MTPTELTQEQSELLAKLVESFKPIELTPLEPKPETYDDIVALLKPKIYISYDLSIRGNQYTNPNRQSSHQSAVYIVALIKLRNMADFYNQEAMWMPEAIMVAFQICSYSNRFIASVDSWGINLGLPLFKRKEDALSALSKLTDEERIAVWGTKEMESN